MKHESAVLANAIKAMRESADYIEKLEAEIDRLKSSFALTNAENFSAAVAIASLLHKRRPSSVEPNWEATSSLAGLLAIIRDMIGEAFLELTALHARVADYESRLSAVMPADFKDWHENARSEWPEVAAWCIANIRNRAEQAEQRNAELEEKAERYRLTTLRQDARVAELVAALREMVDAQDATVEQFTATEIDRLEKSMRVSREVLARAESADLVQEACGGRCGDPLCNLSTEGELMREPAKHPDTEEKK